MANHDTDRSDGMPDTITECSGRNPREYVARVSMSAMDWDHFRPETKQVMNAVVERGNMVEALHRVESTKGAAGIDRMPVSELRSAPICPMSRRDT